MGNEPAVVVGHSLAGVIALAASVRRPIWCPRSPFESPMAWRLVAEDLAGSSGAGQPGRHPEDAAERFMQAWSVTRCGSGCRSGPDASGDPKVPLLADLATIRGDAPYEPARVPVPVLAGYGSESKPYHQQAARRLAEEAPDGELVVVEGSGTRASRAIPEFAALVRRAVERA
jgi:pimeloyl-ACP methyl ester carboxylesterase